MKTKEKGILAEQKVITKFIEHGYTVSSVIGDNARYDLVVEAENKLQRIQVKHARIRNGCVTFNTLSYRINTKKYI
jgi:type V secretory pathway adhesin AidA